MNYENNSTGLRKFIRNWSGIERCKELELGMDVESGDNWKWSSSATESLLIVVPDRFKDGRDGPCNSPELRKMFWTDIFKSMSLSLDFLFAKARDEAKKEQEWDKASGGLRQTMTKIDVVESIENNIIKITNDYPS